jgi:hypothetical protein
MSHLSNKTIRHAGLCIAAAVLTAIFEIGLGCLLVHPVQAVGLPLLAVALLANILIALTMPIG